MKKTHNTAGQKRAMVTRGRKGKDRNDTSNWEMPKNAAGDLVNSFWGYISPNGFRKPTPGAGVLRAMQRRVAEQDENTRRNQSPGVNETKGVREQRPLWTSLHQDRITVNNHLVLVRCQCHPH